MKFVRAFLGSLLAIVFVVALAAGVAAVKMDRKSKIEDGSWLHLDLYGSLPAYDPPSGLAGLLEGDPQTLNSVLMALEMAGHDERIEGVLLQLSAALDAGPGKLEELRRAIERVRSADKPVIAFADNIDLKTLYAASACDSFFCPRPAYVTITGIQRTLPHVRAGLLKIGIKPEVSAIKDYKSAAQLLTREEMTDEARANAEWLLGDIYDRVAAAIEDGRGIDRTSLEEIMDRAQLTATQARELNVVDDLRYWNEMVERCRPAQDADPRIVDGVRYAQEDPTKLGMGGDKKIAVIHAQGNIGGRKNTVNPMLGLMMGHETINAELARARDDEDVAAIVLRIDSGGGESLASDLMGHMVEEVGKVKPVVVSMVDVAASGGYSMAYRANWLVADEMSVTGSIGSITAKFDMSGFYEKIGVSFSHVGIGPNAGWMDSDRAFTEDEYRMFEERHMESFMEWVTDIARARRMTVEEVDHLGQGRVWTGAQAVENGLIDETGGLWEAVAAARRLAEVDAETKTRLWHLPRKQDLVASLLSGDDQALAATGRWLVYRNLRDDVRMLNATTEPGRWHTVAPVDID